MWMGTSENPGRCVAPWSKTPIRLGELLFSTCACEVFGGSQMLIPTGLFDDL
jgi:hypothetical protein